jgi:hypothetical protein
MIQCHILREPICKSSAANGLFSARPAMIWRRN